MINLNHIHLDHIGLSARNIYEAAFRLRTETGLGFYDGGWVDTSGIGSKIVPLGGSSYIQLSGLVDPFALQDSKNAAAKRFADTVQDGDRFSVIVLRADTIEDMQEIAAARGEQVTDNPNGGRIQTNGVRIHVAGISATRPLPKGTPGINYFFDMNTHPSGQPVEYAPGLARPLGIAWVELGGNEADMSKALGFAVSQLPIRFNASKPGIYALGVKTDKGEIVIRRNSDADV